jgi:putative NADH-flavin reductase
VKLIVFGATGATGLEVVRQAIAAGHEVTAVVRREGFAEPGARVVVGTLESPAVAEAVRGHDAVFSGLGTRPWRHEDVCTAGTRAIAGAMAASGVRRLIVLSSQGVGDSALGGLGKVFGALVLRRALADKAAMEALLAATELDWTVVRPGMLTNGGARGTWRAAAGSELRGGKIARADVAAFVIQQLGSSEWSRKAPTLVW